MAIDRAKLRQIILQEIKGLHETEHSVPSAAQQRNALERTVDSLTNALVNTLRFMEGTEETYKNFPVLGTIDQLIDSLVDLVVGREGVIDTEYDTFFRKMRRYAAGLRVYTGKEWQSYFIKRLGELAAAMILDTDMATNVTQSDIVKLRDKVYADIRREAERLIQVELDNLDLDADKSLRKTFLDLGIID
tara:strand:- start:948 stop:1517 length:570 start_codon:yes stop_codon:yes gene_type:complete